MSDEYPRYLQRLTQIVSLEVVPKMAVFDYFTAHAPPAGDAATETVLWFIRSGLYSDITFSLFRLIDRGGERNIHHFLNHTEQHLRSIPWKTPLTLKDIQEHRGALEAHETQVKHLLMRRNKFFGHYGKEFFYDPETLNTTHPFTNEDAKALIRTLQRILSAHTHALNGRGTLSLEGVFYVATERLFDQLRQAPDHEPK